MSLSPSQIEQRLDGISATDIAAILGQHPFRSPIDVWREKTGTAEPFTGNDRTRWGHLLEPVIRSDYEERHGVRVEQCGTLEHPERAWMKATPDGIVYQPSATEPDRGLEIKTHTVRVAGEYGAPGTDEVPAYELAQCMWGMATSGLRRWDLVAFIDGQPSEYVIDRDDELIGLMIERGERFLVDNIRAGVPPEPDGSDAYDGYLRKRWTTNNADLITISGNTDDEHVTFSLIEQGRILRERLAADEAQLETITQTLKAKIGDRAGLTWKTATGKDLKLTWKHSKPQTRIDLPEVVAAIRQSAALVASAKQSDVNRAIKCLAPLHSETVGYSGKAAALSGREMSELIATLHAALVEITKTSNDAAHTKTFTKRPMVWPRQWAAPKSTEER